MFYRIYVKTEEGHNFELLTLLESKYNWIGRSTHNGNVTEYVFKVSIFRYKEFMKDLKLAEEKGYVKEWFEA